MFSLKAGSLAKGDLGLGSLPSWLTKVRNGSPVAGLCFAPWSREVKMCSWFHDVHDPQHERPGNQTLPGRAC